MWILFALTSAIILASRKIQEKNLVGDGWWSIGWMIRVGTLVSAIIIWAIFSRDLTGISDPVIWMALGGILIIYPVQTYLYYRAMHELPLSVFGMMAPIIPVTATIWAILFHGAHLSLGWWIWIFLICTGLVSLFWKSTRKNISSLSIMIAILCYIIIWSGQVIDKFALSHTTPYLYTVLNQFVWLISIFVTSYFLYGGFHFWFYKKNAVMLSSMGCLQWVWYLCSMYALSYAPNIGYATALSNTHAIITAIYGVMVLKEGITRSKIFVFTCMILALISFAFA